LGDDLQPNTTFLELVHGIDKVAQRAGKPIQLPNDQAITLSGEDHGFLKTFAFVLRTAGNVLEDFLATSFLQFVQLEFEVLILGGNSAIADVHTEHLYSYVSKTSSTKCFDTLKKRQVLIHLLGPFLPLFSHLLKGLKNRRF
jgi:hypothetical protein